MTAAWRLVPTDPFRARTRNPALALAVLAHLALLGALAVSALLRVQPVEPMEPVNFLPPPILRIVLPPPPLEPEPLPVLEKAQPYDVQVPRAPAAPPRAETAETLPDVPGGGPDVGDLDRLLPELGPLAPGLPSGPGGPGSGPGPGPGDGPGPGPGGEDGPLQVGGGIERPTLLEKVEPEYPEAARRARIHGTVTVQAVIGRDGTVEDAQIVHSSHRLLEEASLEAVRQWRYAPVLLHGRPVRVTFVVRVEFILN
ncbi:MAG TPA: energy transducer TonB [Candidatus Polarisedimenticolaceae bacterium]|nr:energy transducer TonB [Candidatus Polarisedimenticolaceae bacterium]